MIKLINSLLIVLALISVSACHNDMDSDIDGNHRSQKAKQEHILKSVSMSFGGDYITESEEPLLRAEDGDTYAAVNVWRTEKNTTNAVEEKYAFGLFKNKQEIKLNLVTGYEYRFEASIVIDKDDKIEKSNRLYTTPFGLHTDYHASPDKVLEFEYDLDEFVYSSFDDGNVPLKNGERKCFCELYNGTARVRYGSGKDDWGEYKYPRLKRYYGKLAIFDPEISDEVDIPMAYKSFGLKIVIEDLPSGHLTVEDVSENRPNLEDKLTFPNGLTLEKTNEWEGLYSMNNLLASSETFKLKFTWNKGGGVTESFPIDVTISPKTKKVLKVKITGTPNYETKGNVNFNMESDELSLDEEEVRHDFD